MMEKRPIAVTIIGCWMVLGALLTLYSIATMGSNPVMLRMLEQMHISLRFQQVVGVIGVIVCAVSAYGLFKAQPWSRVLYIGWSIIGLGIGFFTSPVKSFVVISVLIFAVIAYFLFRPDADRYFAAKGLQLSRNDA